MADATTKKYLDYAGLSKYDSLIKAYIGTQVSVSAGVLADRVSAVENSLKDDGSVGSRILALENLTAGEYKVGESTFTTVKGYVDAKVAAEVSAVSSDLSTVKTFVGLGADGKLTIGSGDNASSYATLTSAIDGQIAKVVNDAPEAFDTLKEIADWIGSGDVESTTAASMLADISTLKGADTVEGSVAHAVKAEADRVNGVIGTVPAKVGETDTKTVVAYVDAKVAAANGDVADLETKVDGLYSVVDGGKDTGVIATRLDALETAVGGDESGLVKDVADIKTSLAEGGDTATAIADAQKAADKAQDDVDALGELVGSLPEGATSTTVVGYAKELADAAQAANDALFKVITSGEGEEPSTTYEGAIVDYITAKTGEGVSALDAEVSQGTVVAGEGATSGLNLKIIEEDGKLKSVEGTIDTISNDEIDALFAAKAPAEEVGVTS